MSRWLKRLGYAIGTLLVLVTLLGGFVFVKSSSLLTRKYPFPSEPLTVAADSAALLRGSHLVNVIAKCSDCHDTNLAGKVVINEPALGVVWAPNLTRGQGGVGDRYTDAGMAVAIRHGVKSDSTSALVMPSDSYQELTDYDVAAIVAYVRQMPPVNRTVQKAKLGPLGRALATAGQLPVFAAEYVKPDRPHAATITRGATVEYGSYLAVIGGCTSCHGPGLGGGNRPGEPPDWPQSSNLTPTGIGNYTDAQLEHMLRSGIRPDGTQLRAPMPWPFTAKMTDEEMSATIKYLRSVPPKKFGTR